MFDGSIYFIAYRYAYLIGFFCWFVRCKVFGNGDFYSYTIRSNAVCMVDAYSMDITR